MVREVKDAAGLASSSRCSSTDAVCGGGPSPPCSGPRREAMALEQRTPAAWGAMRGAAAPAGSRAAASHFFYFSIRSVEG